MSAPLLKHKGQIAHVEFSPEDEAFVGRLLGIRHIITFHGETVAELRHAFVEAVEDYLDLCKAKGWEPQKPASGRFLVRLPVELHHTLRAEAEGKGKSLNALVVEKLRASTE
jgi:predicted HicB family RNase H-like nuclease